MWNTAERRTFSPALHMKSGVREPLRQNRRNRSTSSAELCTSGEICRRPCRTATSIPSARRAAAASRARGCSSTTSALRVGGVRGLTTPPPRALGAIDKTSHKLLVVGVNRREPKLHDIRHGGCPGHEVEEVCWTRAALRRPRPIAGARSTSPRASRDRHELPRRPVHPTTMPALCADVSLHHQTGRRIDVRVRSSARSHDAPLRAPAVGAVPDERY
jgi:hypothetical protein